MTVPLSRHDNIPGGNPPFEQVIPVATVTAPPAPPAFDASGRPWPLFAHASEAEMARILDFYAVRWEYEPRTFPILWTLDGAVVESFSPDFHLPELDLYLEMTTLKQRLVRKKNRKLRRLRELYPAINIKLFYARDFRAMLLKYGRLALADSLSGTLGQISSERIPPGPIAPPVPAVTSTGRASEDSTASRPSRSRNASRRQRGRGPSVELADMLGSVHAVPGQGSIPVALAVLTPGEEATDHR